MTRINCIPPGELVRQHLLAEYRELPRVFGLVRAYQDRGGRPDSIAVHGQPKEYVLGKGHVLFFYTRLRWLERRYRALVVEMERRGFEPQYQFPPSQGIDQRWFGDWEPTDEAMRINRARIKERLNG